MASIESILKEDRRFEPSRAFAERANITKEKYEELTAQFKKDPEEFWAELARSELTWFKDFDKVLNDSKPPFYKWFEGGKINISYNCIDRHLEKRGNKAALIWEGEPGDKQSLTYKQLHTQVCKLANALKELGIKKGDVVTIYMPLAPEAVIAMHACNRIGAVHSVVFGGFSAEALSDRIEYANSKLVITADGLYRKGNVIPLAKTVGEAIKGLNCVENVICWNRISNFDNKFKNETGFIDWDEIVSKQNSECEPIELDAEDISFILYTSGSTGKPKGVQHRTAGYLLWTHLTSKWVFDLKEDDVYWCTADVGWITGHSYVSYGPLSNGATCLLYEGAPNHPEPDRFWELIEKYKVSIFYTAPTAIRAFIQWGEEHIKKHDLSSLRLLGTVGEPINPDVWVWYYDTIGNSKCPIVDTWWQTETGGILITTLPGVQEMKPGSAGLALPGIEARINEEGLLNFKSPWVSMLQTLYKDDKHYLNTYWSQVGGAYTAGDGAHQDENGYIEIMGRVDDVINVSGHRLGTAEIESALVTNERISEAAVVSVPHAIKGEGIVAYVVVKGDQNRTDLDLQAEFKDSVVSKIGSIAKPEKIYITSALPKTRSGKIMRRLLKEIAQGKKPEGDMSTLENKSVLEELLKL